nr:Ltp family lipoprotein [Tessaracoccus sp. SD287]
MKKALDYLELTGFSASGLQEQLEFEGFPAADAAYAVKHIDVDWMEQAARKAKEYLDLTSFSRQGLIDQLIFEGFSSKQAAHGADSVGL